MENFTERKTPAGLYDPRLEHDNCGVGAVVDIKGRKTHQTVDDALHIVEHLQHRAGTDAEGKTGDGVGIMLQISHRFFSRISTEMSIDLGAERCYAVGMFFLPTQETRRSQAMKMFEGICRKEELEFLGWRKVPTDPSVLGSVARDCMPSIWQAFIKKPLWLQRGLPFERRLYVVRRTFEQGNADSYVCSLSSRTIVYKGMFLVHELRRFYLDLQCEDYESAIGLVHSRFSTNTSPSWRRAHPNRFILHNGEINTIRGNADTMSAYEETATSPYLKDDMLKIMPIVNQDGSDSAQLDNALEFLVMNGMELPLAMMVTIPEPWSNDKAMNRSKRDFYQYYATMMEPWDGPASILFSDGDVVGAVLDRNGLRPSRYMITNDDRLILSSEVGVVDVPVQDIVEKDRLRPGKMLLVDTVKGCLIDDDELKMGYANRQSYGEWLDSNLVTLDSLKIPNRSIPRLRGETLVQLQKAFGYRYEDVVGQILPMAKNGVEPTGAMGDDMPLAVLSENRVPLFHYFKQKFAQVTNPPLDAIREQVITSTSVYIGARGNLLEEKAENCRVLKVENPILTETDLLKIREMQRPGFKVVTIPITCYKGTGFKAAIDRVFVEVDRAYKDGANIIILSDRDLDEFHVALPSLLAVGAVSKYLVRTKRRTAMALILESAEPREVHHFATLMGYGACAINPYLAQQTLEQLIEEGRLEKDYYAAVADFNRAILNGIVRIASKMGVSTLQSYQSSQIFESIGLDQRLVDEYFTNTVNRVGGIGLAQLQEDVEANHEKAFDPLGLDTLTQLEDGGRYKLRTGKEEHLYNPASIHLLQKACMTGSYETFQKFTEMCDHAGGVNGTHLRSLMEIQYPEKGISIDEVEPVSEIVKHFRTGSMSYGALSQEAHETIAQAMNSLGALSGSGEGGEDESRYGTDKNDGVKQVASARFGVTGQYLISAREIEIKMAQGAKPGEGGHLPGAKVYPWIAKCRHSTTGVGLISPPPHHDIYSIEDLAQLIYDLKCANRKAAIGVKLCSESGVGTIASGVAKAGAQVVCLCGYEGGTGAAPRNSVPNAGMPWELGLAETHQTLILNNLRSRVRLLVDGKLLSGRDIAIAAMLGAEEFGFGTSVLVTLGCVMMRVCHLDTCPMGICTQNPELRKNFKGKPEYVVNFMTFMAQELREIMARLGVRSINELVGRTDLLKPKALPAGSRGTHLDFSAILGNPLIQDNRIHFDPNNTFDFKLENTMDMKVLQKKFKKAFETGEHKEIDVEVGNMDRTFGTIFGSDITAKYGNALPDDTFVIHAHGSGGQSFGSFLPKGMTITLEGDCNDYLGKGLSGGKLTVFPPKGITFKPENNIIIGNVALYGATGGKAFVNGVAGERFCVRNSGADAVVEGVGDHGCEYMTGGTVVVLGNTGKNFAAGMSGGVAFVLDENRDLYTRVNKAMVALMGVENKHDIDQLRNLIQQHVEATGSARGQQILDHFSEYLPKFKKVLPIDYDKMLRAIAKAEESGLDKEQAQIEAFYSMKNN